jgi:phosphoglucomutase
VATNPRAGQPAALSDLVDVPHLVTAYYSEHPDPSVPEQRVSFGTSGHRGSSLRNSFNDDHIAATTQAICDYRKGAGIDGPLFLARDTHALSEPAWVTAVEVLAANDVTVLVDSRDGYTPTPALSYAVLAHNRGRADRGGRGGGAADGIVVTPSHNPPTDGGFKYNPPDGGPAGTEVTTVVQDRANALLAGRLAEVRRIPLARARAAATTGTFDFLDAYVSDLPSAIDLGAIAAAGARVGADPLGGASVAYWGVIGERYGLDLTVVNPVVDPTWRFMTLDWDGKIRMDCSSPYAMAALIERRHEFGLATGNDADADRHGIVTPDGGLMGPNAFLSVAIDYLFAHRPGWPAGAAVGKTLVSSSMIDRVAAGLGRRLVEVPVGFKWFVTGLLDGAIGFGGEESAGASFLRRDGSVWTTDKDGLLLCLLASEILAVTGSSPSQRYDALTDRFGRPAYARVDAPASREEKAVLAGLRPEDVTATELGGEPVTAKLTTAPGNGAPIGGLKVMTASSWFAARPSGTEDVYKIYAESWKGPDHLALVQDEAKQVVANALHISGHAPPGDMGG